MSSINNADDLILFLARECAIDLASETGVKGETILAKFGERAKQISALKESLSLDVKTFIKENRKVPELQAKEIIAPYFLETQYNLVLKNTGSGYLVVCTKKGDDLSLLNRREINYCKKCALSFHISMTKVVDEILLFMKTIDYRDTMIVRNNHVLDMISFSHNYYYLVKEGLVIKEDDHDVYFAIGCLDDLNGKVKPLDEHSKRRCTEIGIDFTNSMEMFHRELMSFDVTI